MALPSGTNLGPYQILQAIGAGGMGEVYRARDTKLKREVAIKVLPEEFARDSGRMSRFQREAELLAALNHPHIAAIYGVEERALVMELVEGETLPCPLPLDAALNYAKQIAEALEYAHEKGVIHRDLKPANIKVTPDGTVKLLDFGLAKAVQDPSARDDDPSNSPTLTLGATRVGVILGTAAYMSPEQAAGKPADRRSDIWSFGAVLYEMLAGKQAFTGESVSDTLASVLKLDPDWSALPDSAPASIRKLIQRCLTRDRRQRLQAIGEARIAIEQELANPEIRSEVPSGSNDRPSRWRWVLATSVMAAALGTVSFLHFRELRSEAPALRYTIATPENSTVLEFAISPDGRYVAIAVSTNGRSQLWLRALKELELQPLPSTDDATGPFWSPDSRQIGFFAQGRLKRIAVGGGSAQTLSTAQERVGGSWNRDDVILFASSEGLQSVPATGGVPATVIKGDRAYRFPQFLPDGHHFLYMISSGSPTQGMVHWSSLNGGEDRAILENVTSAVFASSAPGNADGYLLFLREDTLMAQRFNAVSAQTSGGQFPLAEGIKLNARGPYTPVTASDNGTLMYWNSSAANSNSITWFDRSGKPPEPLGAAGTIIQPSISPDEKTVVFGRTVGTQIGLWLWDLARKTDTLFTNDGGSTAPAWSPEGDRIVFRSERNGSAGDLYLKSVNGTGQEQLLVKTGSNKIPSQWSRDGKYIVYSDSGRDNWDVWVLPVGDGDLASVKPIRVVQTAYRDFQGQLSPDSHWMAYVSNESGQNEVYVKSFPDGAVTKKISTAGGVQPRWRADGKELFFIATGGKMTAVPVKFTSEPKPSFEPGSALPLFDLHVDEPGIAMRYDVTRDGTRFLVETAAASSAPRLTVWSNWLAGIKK
jgi:serine/threonine protein kinase